MYTYIYLFSLLDFTPCLIHRGLNIHESGAMRNKRVEFHLDIHEGGVDVNGAIKALQYSIELPPPAWPGQSKLWKQTLLH